MAATTRPQATQQLQRTRVEEPHALHPLRGPQVVQVGHEGDGVKTQHVRGQAAWEGWVEDCLRGGRWVGRLSAYLRVANSQTAQLAPLLCS